MVNRITAMQTVGGQGASKLLNRVNRVERERMAEAKPIATESKPNQSASSGGGRPRKIRGPSKLLDNGANGKEALIDATCGLLHTMPPDKISQAAVARAARVHPSLVGYYFSDFRNLLVLATEKLCSDYHARLSKALASEHARSRDHIRERIEIMLEMGEEFPFFHRLMTDVVNQALPGSEALYKKIVGQGIASYDQLVLDGCRDGEFRNVSGRWLMAAIVAICDAFGSQQPVMKLGKEENFDREQERREYSKFAYDIVMNGIGAPSADANPKVHEHAEQISALLQENDALRRALAQSVLEKQILIEKM